MTYKVDDREQQALFRHYDETKLKRMFNTAARSGANAAAEVLQAAAPVGDSQPLSELYQRYGLQHGALKASVAARKIRRRGARAATIGFVVGPGGRAGFTRHWVTGGTRPHRVVRRQHPGTTGDPWVDRAAREANAAAKLASDVVVVRYVSRIPGA
jgi:hypothetical protein